MGIVSLWEELKWDCILVGGIKMGFESWAEISSQWVHSGHHNVQPVTKDCLGNTIRNTMHAQWAELKNM